MTADANLPLVLEQIDLVYTSAHRRLEILKGADFTVAAYLAGADGWSPQC